MCCRGERPADASTRAALAAQRVAGVFVTTRKPYSVANARNAAVRQMYDDGFDALMFVDEDIVLQLDAAELLLGVGADICVGQYPCIRRVRGLQIPYIPIVTREPTDDFEDFQFRWLDRSTPIVPCYRAATGCMLIHRRVFDKLGFPYFRWPPDLVEGEKMGEDVDFCDRARAAGFSIKAHTHIRCGHNVTQDVASQIVQANETPHDISWPGPQSVTRQQEFPAAASHLPILHAIAQSFSIKNVIEFGMGRFSTPAFLDKAHFPVLENLYSLESNEDWLAHNVEQIADERLHPIFCHLGRMTEQARFVPTCDLVFIDCDGEADGDPNREWQRPDSRAKGKLTYRMRRELLSAYENSDAIVVVHDTEHPELQQAVDIANYRYRTTHESRTGVYTTALSRKHDVCELQWPK